MLKAVAETYYKPIIIIIYPLIGQLTVVNEVYFLFINTSMGFCITTVQKTLDYLCHAYTGPIL